jgi:hypothetical protein
MPSAWILSFSSLFCWTHFWKGDRLAAAAWEDPDAEVAWKDAVPVLAKLAVPGPAPVVPGTAAGVSDAGLAAAWWKLAAPTPLGKAVFPGVEVLLHTTTLRARVRGHGCVDSWIEQ